jgi:hypothetical protein
MRKSKYPDLTPPVLFFVHNSFPSFSPASSSRILFLHFKISFYEKENYFGAFRVTIRSLMPKKS